ncbi:MAG: TerD family protein [Arthrobacter sp.]|nr:TerD family protein [Arthrobacter sp.]
MAINLGKGQSINLTKQDGASLKNVRMGLGWDAKVIEKKGLFGGIKRIERDIDLDASALLCDANGPQEIVYFGQLRSRDGSVVHTGDNRTGAGDGDDESIKVDLTALPAWVQHVYFVVNSYTGETFSEIDNAFVRVVDSDNRDQELARYSLSANGPFTAMLMARVSRGPQGWAFTALGEPGQGRVANELVALVARNIAGA